MKKTYLLSSLFVTLFVGTLALLSSSALATTISAKKGVGLAEKDGYGAKQLSALNVGWYYNWGSTTSVGTTAQFVPMIFSLKSLTATITGNYVLGFNEPDNANQSNIAVKDALAAWPTVVAKAPVVGSPAMAGNPLTVGGWFYTFMQSKPKVDFVTVHWYKGVDSNLFKKDIQAIYTQYGKPIWITEFAPQTASSAASSPNKYTQTQVNQFIATVIPWMETTSYVQRYAWHNSKTGTSALFDASGALTATGITYANTVSPAIPAADLPVSESDLTGTLQMPPTSPWELLGLNAAWFGEYDSSQWPWIYQSKLGWVWIYGKPDHGGTWLQLPASKVPWVWTSATTYPWVWGRNTTADISDGWLYITHRDNQRWFYIYDKGLWVKDY